MEPLDKFFEAATVHFYCTVSAAPLPIFCLSPSALYLPSMKLFKLPFTLQTAYTLHYAMFLN